MANRKENFKVRKYRNQKIKRGKQTLVRGSMYSRNISRKPQSLKGFGDDLGIDTFDPEGGNGFGDDLGIDGYDPEGGGTGLRQGTPGFSWAFTASGSGGTYEGWYNGSNAIGNITYCRCSVNQDYLIMQQGDYCLDTFSNLSGSSSGMYGNPFNYNNKWWFTIDTGEKLADYTGQPNELVDFLCQNAFCNGMSGSCSPSAQTPLGDVNNDFNVNVQDVVMMVNLITSGTPAQQIAQQYPNADLTGDGQVHIQDVVQLIQLITNNPSNLLSPADRKMLAQQLNRLNAGY